jgi:hypothetical protein
MMLAAAAVAAGLTVAGEADAQIAGVDNICEIAGLNVVKTVKVRTMSLEMLDYTFRNLATAQLFTFPATAASSAPRTFSLPPGSYAFTFKHPNSAPVGTFHNTVVVKPYAVVRGKCLLTMDTRSSTVGPPRQ